MGDRGVRVRPSALVEDLRAGDDRFAGVGGAVRVTQLLVGGGLAGGVGGRVARGARDDVLVAAVAAVAVVVVLFGYPLRDGVVMVALDDGEMG